MLEQKKKDKIELSTSKDQNQKKENFLGAMYQHRNHTLYEINKDTLEFEEAKFEKVDYVVGNPKPNRKVMIKQGFIYRSALNRKNMQRKLDKAKV